MKNKKILVLDIDNTLIYACHHEIKDADCGVYSIGKDVYRIYKRPNVDCFLEYVFENFNVAIWSSAWMEHIENVIDYLKIDKQKLLFIYDSKKCTQHYSNQDDTIYILKKFHKLKRKGYDLTQIIGVDDNYSTYMLNYGNLLPVKAWFGNCGSKIDTELLLVMKYLEKIKDVPNIRDIYKNNWKEQLLLK